MSKFAEYHAITNYMRLDDTQNRFKFELGADVTKLPINVQMAGGETQPTEWFAMWGGGGSDANIIIVSLDDKAYTVYIDQPGQPLKVLITSSQLPMAFAQFQMAVYKYLLRYDES